MKSSMGLRLGMGKVGAAAFSPADLSDLQLWFKADAITGKSDGDALTSWADESGNGRNATMVANPTYETNEVNGQPVVRLNGSNQYGTIADFVYTLTGLTVFAVVKNDDEGTGHAYMGHYDAGAGQRSWYLARESTANDGQVQGVTSADGGSVNAKTYDGGHRPKTDWHIAALRFDADTLEVFINGLLQNSTKSTDGTVASLHNSTAALTIGAVLNSGAVLIPHDGDIAELIVFDAALSAANRALVEEYLSAKYAIGRQGGRLFKPQVLSGLMADYDAEQGGDDFNADNDLVATWPSWHDEGATALDIAQAGADSLKPTFKVNIQNGRPILRFDGGDWLERTGLSLTAMTVFAVFSVAAGSGFRRVVGERPSASGQQQWSVSLSGTELVQWTNSSDGSGSNTIATASGLSGAQLITGINDGTNMSMRLNGVLDPEGEEALVLFDGSALLMIGAREGTPDQFYDSDLARILIYNRNLTAPEVTDIEAYINDKYAIY